ncbi:MAG TPA: hypothetical protein ENI53_00475, partial [Thermoplasmatales archaeon]|nr:hypothetical protein [Thermoplasmatales archaeon]
MNPFLNPFTLARVAKYYLSDINRVWRLNENEIEKYREREFKKILKLAMLTPLYREKYKGIDIKKINLERIEELPILTKKDLRKHFPDGIVPANFNKEKAH